MSTKTFVAIAGFALTLTLAAAARPAQAQSVYFTVLASSTTNGQPGAASTTTGGLANQTSAYSESDPAGVEFGSVPQNTVYADTGAHSWADTGELHAITSAVANRLAATSFPASPQASTEGRFTDRITVTSASLPNGTPVTLNFRNAIEIGLGASSAYNGSVTTYFQVGSVVVSTRWDVANGKPVPTTQSPLLEVKTTVGSVLYTSGKLNTLARASYYASGPIFDGSIEIDATAALRLESASDDVTLVAASGIDYNPTAN